MVEPGPSAGRLAPESTCICATDAVTGQHKSQDLKRREFCSCSSRDRKSEISLPGLKPRLWAGLTLLGPRSAPFPAPPASRGVPTPRTSSPVTESPNPSEFPHLALPLRLPFVRTLPTTTRVHPENPALPPCLKIPNVSTPAKPLLPPQVILADFRDCAWVLGGGRYSAHHTVLFSPVLRELSFKNMLEGVVILQTGRLSL